MESDETKNINLPCVQPSLDSWGAKSEAGDWSISPSYNFKNTSVQERNAWYTEAMMSTVEAFSSLARVSRVSFGSLPDSDNKSFKWDLEESYEKYLEKVCRAIQEYPVDIFRLYILLDLFVYIRTKESPNKPIRTWVGEFGDSIGIGEIQIEIDSLMDYEPFLYFETTHTLFYPDSWDNHEDNSELAQLNQPLLEEALKNWEQKFDAEIEAEGLPGIYKYGFLPEDQW